MSPHHRLLLALLLTLPLACGDGGDGATGEDSTPASTPAIPPSPATTGTRGVTTLPGATVAGGQPGGPATPARVTPSSMQVDLEGRRVFLPHEGWLTAEEFWRIYFDEPQRLPGDLDFEAVNQLRPMSPAPTAQR